MAEQAKPGYSDTPVIPGMIYKVHDCDRPQPRVITPAVPAAAEAAAVPSDAVILFNGQDLTGWTKLDGSPAEWEVIDGTLAVVPKTGNIKTTATFGDCQLHLEFRSPEVVKGESQGRGNSGVFLMGLYEIQVLDCYDNPTYADGTTGGIYGQYPPLVNACRAPGEWNVYDILWEGPKFGKPARVTVMLNGVVLHHATELQGPTQHRKLAEYAPQPAEGPLMLQDHGDLVRFRNIWYRELKPYDE